jgi:hypothetical protein
MQMFRRLGGDESGELAVLAQRLPAGGSPGGGAGRQAFGQGPAGGS